MLMVKFRTFIFQTAIGYAIYQSCKNSYCAILVLLAALNHYIVKYKVKMTRHHTNKKLHLGCGNTYLDGWINIDYYVGFRRKKDLWLDITNGLPYGDCEIDAIFTSHTLEHFPYRDVIRVLKECYRVLGRCGVVRIAVPSMTLAIESYLKKKDNYFKAKGRTVSGKFIKQILYYGAHRTMFDFDFLKELLEDTGFSNIKNKRFMESDYFEETELIRMDQYEDQTMFVECTK